MPRTHRGTAGAAPARGSIRSGCAAVTCCPDCAFGSNRHC